MDRRASIASRKGVDDAMLSCCCGGRESGYEEKG